jgi:hypothetical protein
MSLPPIASEDAFVAVVDEAQSYHELLKNLENELKQVLQLPMINPSRLEEVEDESRGHAVATRLHGMETCCPLRKWDTCKTLIAQVTGNLVSCITHLMLL